ncbi:LysR substrate-binding domain-containing protein, partial [Acinetobacter baumannii]|uniref:LysR substrate-binding domain-containing protein n=1 Tax=Acinetobacter baumannii TaxID=470 RepID=UPI003AF7024D
HQQLPKIQLHLHEAQCEKIVERLEHGNLDMIVLALPFDTRSLIVAEISKENLYLVCSKQDTNELQANSLDDLDLSRLILLEEGH